MIWRGIRSQVLFVALAPAVLVALVLTAVFVFRGVADIAQAHQQRLQALVSQLATNAEFGLFAGNRPALQALAAALLREPDVASVIVLDRDGRTVAAAGEPLLALPPLAGLRAGIHQSAQGARSLVARPVVLAEITGDPLFEKSRDADAQREEVLGFVAIEMTGAGLQALERSLILIGLATTVAGLLFGSLIAVRLSRGVSRPLTELAQTVEQVERGELEARVPVDRDSPLRGLEEGVNRMASSIQQARDDLERRIEAATAALRQRTLEAEEANVAKSRFVAAASHDLRQPMHALGLFVDNLRDEVGAAPKARRLVDSMRRSLDAMTVMFDALLDISRLDAGVVPVVRMDFPVARVMRQMETMFSGEARQRGLRFGIVGSGAWVHSDPALLERIVQNLVSNALKHTLSGGVVLGCRWRRAGLAIEVRDTGPGIAPEHQQEVFKEFFQLGNPERDRNKGLGLGLAIVDRIARVLEHPLYLRSAPGRGSVFGVVVPWAELQPRETPPTQLELIADDFAGACVAVIDDDAASLEAMTLLLEKWDCRVIGAESAAEALHRIGRSGVRPNLLLCDYRLRGGANGIHAIGEIRAGLGAQIPAVLFTGDTAPDRLAEAHASGFTLLHKPVAPDTLRDLLRDQLLPRDGPAADTAGRVTAAGERRDG